MVYIIAFGVYLVCYGITVKLCSAHGVYFYIWRIYCVLQYYCRVMQCVWCIFLHLAYILYATVLQGIYAVRMVIFLCLRYILYATVLQLSYAVHMVYITAFGVYLVRYSATVFQ